MVEAFCEWLEDEVQTFIDELGYFVKSALALIFVIITLPAWIIPFLYWHSAVWKKGEEENEREGSN